MRDDTVIWSGTLNGEDVSITLGEAMANDAIFAELLRTAIERKLGSAATNKAEDETAEAAKLQRAHQIKAGEEWSRGGGNALSDAERHRRDILAAYAATHLGLKRSKAEERARKDRVGLLSETAAAIVAKKDGKKPSKDRLDAATSKFADAIEAKVKERMQQAESVDI